MKQLKYAAALLAAGMLTSTGAQAAIVAGNFSVSSAQLLSLYSGTLDPACTLAAPGSFFTCDLPLPAGVISIASSAGGAGHIDLLYDDVTGEVTQITRMDMFLADLVITITGSAFGSGVVTVTQGNSFPNAYDRPRIRAGTATSDSTVLLQPAGVATGNADVDQDPTVGRFRHDPPGTVNDSPDFARFSQIVDSCVPNPGDVICNLVPGLAIDAVRYEIVGIVSGGVYNGALRAETGNNSNYFVNFQSTIVPVPAAVWLFGSALGLAGLMRRKAV